MAALEAKGLPYESKLLEFSKGMHSVDFWNQLIPPGDHKSPEVMALNPRGQIPTFKDGDAIVNESGAICMYLETQYPEKPLLPKDPTAKAKVCVG